jgi:hypothetical protein
MRHSKQVTVVVTMFATLLTPVVSLLAASAVAASYSLNEDTPRMFVLRGSGNRGETVTYSIATPPAHGVVSLSGQNAVYTPTANYNGADSFTFKVNGSSSGSATATVALSVVAVNDAPMANSPAVETISTTSGAAVSFQLTGSDVDGDQLTYLAVSATGGALSVQSSTGVGTYTPNAGFSGSGSITYRVYDGKIYSSSVTLPVEVIAVNRAPSAANVSRTITEDNETAITLQGSDPDGDVLTYVITTEPLHGSVAANGSTATYIPASNYNGTDSFSYAAHDGEYESSPATVSLTINAANDAPTAQAVSVTTGASAPVTITLAGADVDNDPLAYTIISSPIAGTLSTVAGNTVVYTPAPSSSGNVSFNYGVSDGKRSVSNTVTITINGAPLAHKVTGELVQGGSIVVLLSVSDKENDPTTYRIVANPEHGSLHQTEMGWLYTPNPDFTGVDTAMFVANDGYSDSAAGTIRFNVTPPTGLEQTPILQWGLNFIDINNENTLQTLQELGAQAVRQVGSGDYGWGNVQTPEGRTMSSATTAAFREGLDNAGIAVINTFNQNLFASPTPYWVDWLSDYSLFEHEIGASYQSYLDSLLAYMASSLPGDTIVINEAGNEMFHWLLAYPDLNFTVEEQAKMVGQTIEQTSAALNSAGYTVVNQAPSIMLESSDTWDWWSEFLSTLDREDIPGSSADLDTETYHFYSNPDNYLQNRRAFEQAGAWIPGMIMNLTEFGFSDDPTTTRVPNPSPQTKASRLVQTAVMAWGSGDSFVSYHRPYNDTTADNSLRGTGLIDAHTGVWTPAAYNYKLISNEIVPFDQVTELNSPDEEQKLYQFRLPSGELVYVAWGSGNIVVPTGVSVMTSMYTEDGVFVWSPIVAGQSITLSDIPVMIK